MGLGPMGRALAGAFLDKSHPTTVWNRTAAKADALVARGAMRADTVCDAVSASPLVVVCVIDCDAVHAILGPTADALRGRTPGEPHRRYPRACPADGHVGRRARHRLPRRRDPVPPTIGGSAAAFLYSGPKASHQAQQPALASLGGTATYVGADPGRAAAYDVALLDIFWASTSGIAHAFALAAGENIASEDLAPFARGIGGLLPDVIDEHASTCTTAIIPATCPTSRRLRPEWSTSSTPPRPTASTPVCSAPPARSPGGPSTRATAGTTSPV